MKKWKPTKKELDDLGFREHADLEYGLSKTYCIQVSDDYGIIQIAYPYYSHDPEYPGSFFVCASSGGRHYFEKELSIDNKDDIIIIANSLGIPLKTHKAA